MNKLLLLLLFLCIISILLHKNTNTLLVIIIIVILVSFLPQYFPLSTSTDNIIKDTNIISKTSNNYKVKENKQNLKYIIKDNKELLDIIENIRFIKRYDKARYIDLLNLANTFNKTYIYIMSDRWDLKHFLPILKDLRKDILETLYSIYIIIPVKKKNKLEETIEKFDKYSINKLEIVKKYGYDTKGIQNMLETRIDAFNEREKNLLP